MSSAGLSLMIVLALAGCNVDNEVNTERSQYDDVPVMVVDPGFLDFGGLGTGESSVQSFTIRNEGGIPLEISEVRIEGATGFTLLTTATGDIAPGGSVTVDVMYQPTNLTDAATIRIFGDDEFNPEDQVTLGGEWLLPILAIEPDPYEFGAVPFGCLTGKTLMLSNIGSDTLVIDSIVQMGDGYSLPAMPALPVEIAPGDHLPLQLLYESTGAELQTNQVWVSSNDPSGAKVATQSGWGIIGDCVEIGVPEGERVTVDLAFTVEAGLADIAFALDTTSSMSGLALAMASEFSNIVADLDLLFTDATYGVATFDDYAESPFGGAGTDLPFILRQQQTELPAVVQRALEDEVAIHYGDDTPESTMEALYQGLTGVGFDHDCDGLFDPLTDVPPFEAAATDLFGGTAGGAGNASTVGGGTIGGFGFRENMLPIIIYATDAPLRDADSGEYSTPRGACHAAGHTDVVNAANGLNAKLVGIGVNVMTFETAFGQMEALAAATESYADLNGDGVDEPAVITWSGTSAQFREDVVATVTQLIAAMNYEKITLVASDDSLGFVAGISPEAFYDVQSGEEVTFTVTLDGVLPAQDYQQANQLTFFLIGDDETLLHTYTVTVITPTN
ncbi:MAG: choice-of-anchor D domain-containing protein [Pseudomonadota bacterium]|nr:choice-of-anchor D domain-containing protein [Pseudomonadota bacterium]